MSSAYGPYEGQYEASVCEKYYYLDSTTQFGQMVGKGYCYINEMKKKVAADRWDSSWEKTDSPKLNVEKMVRLPFVEAWGPHHRAVFFYDNHRQVWGNVPTLMADGFYYNVPQRVSGYVWYMWKALSREEQSFAHKNAAQYALQVKGELENDVIAMRKLLCQREDRVQQLGIRMVTWQTKNEASGKWSDCRPAPNSVRLSNKKKVYSDEKKASPVTAQETAQQQPRPTPQVLAQPQYVQPQYVEPAKPQPQEEYVDLVDDSSINSMNTRDGTTTLVDVVDETGSVVAQKPAPVPANTHLTGGGYGGPKHDSWYQQQEYQRQQAYDQQVNYSPNYTPATAIGLVAPPVQDVCQDVCELTQSFAQLKCTQAYVDMTCPQPTYDEQWGCKKGFSGNAPIWRPTCA